LTASIRDALRHELPADQLPHAIVLVPTLPVSAVGKLDRRCLARLPLPASAFPEAAASASESDAAVAGLPQEARAVLPAVQGIMAEVLGMPAVGPLDSFFDLGGSSLGLTHVAGLVNRRLGVNVPPSALLADPTPLVRRPVARASTPHALTDVHATGDQQKDGRANECLCFQSLGIPGGRLGGTGGSGAPCSASPSTSCKHRDADDQLS
jgi:hypothetical protein